MSTATVNREYLSRIFSTMNPVDTSWAIKTLTERLDRMEKPATPAEPQRKAWWPHRLPVPEAVKNMTMKHRKSVSFETEEDYRDALTRILEEKYK